MFLTPDHHTNLLWWTLLGAQGKEIKAWFASSAEKGPKRRQIKSAARTREVFVLRRQSQSDHYVAVVDVAGPHCQGYQASPTMLTPLLTLHAGPGLRTWH